MKLATTRSPKFRRLMNLTGLSRPTAAGTLELLWLFTMEQAPGGNVGRWSDGDIEAELDWTGESGALVCALVSAGWIDRCATHRLVIHDWADHLPEFLQKRVDRKQLAVAVASPCPDLSGLVGTSRDMSGLVGVREEKRREEKPREEKRREDKEPPAPRSCLCPGALSDHDSGLASEWAAGKGLTPEQVAHAWDRVRDWSHSKSLKRTDWLATLRNAITDGWALKGYGANSTGESESPAQAKARRTKEAGAKAYEMIQASKQPRLGLIEGGAA